MPIAANSMERRVGKAIGGGIDIANLVMPTHQATTGGEPDIGILVLFNAIDGTRRQAFVGGESYTAALIQHCHAGGGPNPERAAAVVAKRGDIGLRAICLK